MRYGYYTGGMYYDWTIILVLIGVAICAIASARVNIAFNKYNNVRILSGLTGMEAARRVLDMAGLDYVRIERVSGKLSDHYDPRDKVLRLSADVYSSASVAAVSVAAHEAGHAIQDATNYGPLGLRSAAVPVARFGSMVYWPLVIIGLITGYMGVAQIGVLLFAAVVLFQLITLPVEFNASSRALQILESSGIYSTDEELRGGRAVLKAAALTYVASLLSSILQLLRLVLITGGGDRRRRD